MPYSQQPRWQTSDLGTRERAHHDSAPPDARAPANGLHDAGSYPAGPEGNPFSTESGSADSGAEPLDDGGVMFLDDSMDRLRADWVARRNGGGHGENSPRDEAARLRVVHAIHLTESALVEVSLAGLRPELIQSYLAVIGELHALRDGRARPAPGPASGPASELRPMDRRVGRGRADATVGGAPRAPTFTPRQKAVVELLLTGASTRKIAAGLELAEGTVKIHLAAIYRTLGVRSRAEAIARLK